MIDARELRSGDVEGLQVAVGQEAGGQGLIGAQGVDVAVRVGDRGGSVDLGQAGPEQVSARCERPSRRTSTSVASW